jgi:hypothetical protein
MLELEKYPDKNCSNQELSNSKIGKFEKCLI